MESAYFRKFQEFVEHHCHWDQEQCAFEEKFLNIIQDCNEKSVVAAISLMCCPRVSMVVIAKIHHITGLPIPAWRLKKLDTTVLWEAALYGLKYAEKELFSRYAYQNVSIRDADVVLALQIDDAIDDRLVIWAEHAWRSPTFITLLHDLRPGTVGDRLLQGRRLEQMIQMAAEDASQKLRGVKISIFRIEELATFVPQYYTTAGNVCAFRMLLVLCENANYISHYVLVQLREIIGRAGPTIDNRAQIAHIESLEKVLFAAAQEIADIIGCYDLCHVILGYL